MSLYHVHSGWAPGLAPVKHEQKHVKEVYLGQPDVLTIIMIPLVE